MKSILLSLILILITLSSCVSPVIMVGNKERVKELKKVALVEVAILPVYKHTFPLIDAAIFNSNLDDAVPMIMKYNAEKIDYYSNFLGEKLNEYFDFEVLYGDELFQSDSYRNLSSKVTLYSKRTDDADFNKIFIPKDSYNFIDFSSGETEDTWKTTNDRFTINNSFKNTIITICSELDVDGIVMAVSRILPIQKPGFLTLNWARHNSIGIHFYDKGGNDIFHIKNNANPRNYDTGDGEEFPVHKKAMDKYDYQIEKMLKIVLELEENEFKKFKRKKGSKRRNRE
jgi:hypothetical protein